MSPDDEQSPDDAAPTRPVGIPLTAIATMVFSFTGVQRAEDQLARSRSVALAPPRDLNGAIAQATWRTAQDHRGLTIATDVGTLVVSVLLFVAGSRVLFRPRGGGWIWRQALLASALVAAATVAVDHALRLGRIAALHALLANPALHIPMPPQIDPHVVNPADLAALMFNGETLRSWIALLLLGAALFYASRQRNRASLDA